MPDDIYESMSNTTINATHSSSPHQPVIALFIFLLVLFLYTHLSVQWKVSEDLEIYEADYRNPSQLEELCALRQPFLLNLRLHVPPFFDKVHLGAMQSCHGVDVRVQDTNEYWQPHMPLQQVVLPLSGALQLMRQPKGPGLGYVVENNDEFVDECGYTGLYETMDALLKPSFCVHRRYDLCFGSKDAYLPMRYHTHSRRFVAVTAGKIHVKMSPWKCRKYLHAQTDWDTMDHRSPVDMWRATPQQQYVSDREKVRCLAFDVHAGHVLYIPPYWWYSIQYGETTTVAAWTYATVLNMVAHGDAWVRNYLELQQQQPGPLASAAPVPVQVYNVPEACLPLKAHETLKTTATTATAATTTTTEKALAPDTTTEKTTTTKTIKAIKTIEEEQSAAPTIEEDFVAANSDTLLHMPI